MPRPNVRAPQEVVVGGECHEKRGAKNVREKLYEKVHPLFRSIYLKGELLALSPLKPFQ